MTRKANILIAFLAVLLVGCALVNPKAKPVDRYADAERAFQVAVDTATAAYQAGKLDPAAVILIRSTLVEANGALIQMRARLREGNQPEAAYWLDRVEAALRVAQSYLLNPPKIPTTKG